MRSRACATPASLVGVPPPAAALLATATTAPPRPLPLPPPPPPLLLRPTPAGAGMAAVDALSGRQAAGRWEKVRRTHPPRQWPSPLLGRRRRAGPQPRPGCHPPHPAHQLLRPASLRAPRRSHQRWGRRCPRRRRAPPSSGIARRGQDDDHVRGNGGGGEEQGQSVGARREADSSMQVGGKGIDSSVLPGAGLGVGATTSVAQRNRSPMLKAQTGPAPQPLDRGLARPMCITLLSRTCTSWG